MVTFSIIKLAADVLLVFAIGFLGLRILKNGNISGKSSEMLMLEASLKGLIKDSESASRHLNDELQRRQNSLERVLNEIDGAEKRLNQVTTSIAETKPQLEKKIQEGRELIVSLTKTTSESALRLQSRAVQSEPQPAEVAPEPPSFESVVPKETAKHRLPSRMKNSDVQRQQDQQRQQPLAKKIEREVTLAQLPAQPPAPNPTAKDRFERVYNAVEAMVKAGHDLKTIARVTKLPEERVKLLQELMVERSQTKNREQDQNQGQDQEEGKAKEFGADPRLGVLGGMKRQVQTL